MIAMPVQYLTILMNLLFSVITRIVFLEEERYLINVKNEELSHAYLTFSLFVQNFYKLLFITTTSGQCNIPNPRIENALFPNFVHSILNGRDFFTELERYEHLFWNLTGESPSCRLYVMSARQFTCEQGEEMLAKTSIHTFWICATGSC